MQHNKIEIKLGFYQSIKEMDIKRVPQREMCQPWCTHCVCVVLVSSWADADALLAAARGF